jgi:hypothetical protein
MGANEDYKKYKYIIWSQEEGLFSIDSISDDDLKSISTALNIELTKRVEEDTSAKFKKLKDC